MGSDMIVTTETRLNYSIKQIRKQEDKKE